SGGIASRRSPRNCSFRLAPHNRNSEFVRRNNKMGNRLTTRVAIGLLALGTVIALPMGSAGAAGSKAKALVGTFRLTAGSCSGTTATGTYFRMIYPGGTVTGGKFFDNPDSTCTADFSYTPVTPGTAGGLVPREVPPWPPPALLFYRRCSGQFDPPAPALHGDRLRYRHPRNRSADRSGRS